MKLDSKILDRPMCSDLVQLLPQPQDAAFSLLYRGSRDGFDATSFHRMCDGKAATVTVIRSSKGNVFGGYAELHWDSGSGWTNDLKAFIFSLRGPSTQAGKPIRLFPTANPGQALYRNAGYGPTFGPGHDLHVANAMTSTANTLSMPNAYQMVRPTLAGRRQ